ncbi:MAG TPA: YicC family protein [Synergistaceae bacterium]|nr:YicC family protein [Synergistaceae bacterium]HPJ24631.1 YicC family protein [Synergistaceae bacterium]HPQ36174.1 YicC family protein [Synergistaceae bacterium]
MTGYGRSQKQTSWGSLECTLSSVNHRYQDISVRVPRDLSYMEQEIQNRLRKKSFRGKMQVRVSFSWSSEQRVVPISEDVLGEYFRKIQEIQKKYHIIEDVRIDSLLQLPGVLNQDDLLDEELAEELKEYVFRELEQAFLSWDTMRSTEGEHLHEDMRRNLLEAEEFLCHIEERWNILRKELVPLLRDKLKNFVEEALPEASFEENRILQEAAILAEKQDIAEEICRFRSHMEKLERAMKEDGFIGRKVEFLLQEVNREVNTIGSKSNDENIRWYVVEIKARLERIREQIQNVE